MRGYGRDEYEDWDECEEVGEEQDGEECGEDGYEETEQPTRGQLEYLELRQRLKESIRKQMKKDLGTANSGSCDKINACRKDNYGSFFGPSQPVIAQRVIQESKSLLENPDLAARIYKQNHTHNKSSASVSISSKPQSNYPPTVTNGVEKRVEILKNTRDYSFLLSEDADVPASLKSPPAKSVLAAKSDVRSAQIMPTSKHVVSDLGRKFSNGRDGRKLVAGSSQSKHVVSDLGREFSNGRNGRKLMAGSSQSKHVVSDLGGEFSNGRDGRKPMVGSSQSKVVANDRGREVCNGHDGRKPMVGSSQSKHVMNDHRREVSNGRDGRKPLAASSQNKPKVGLEKSLGKLLTEPRKQHGNNIGSEPGRPLGSKSVPSKGILPATRKVSQSFAKDTISNADKSTPSSLQSGARKPAPSHLQSGMHRPNLPNGQSSLLKKSSVQKNYQETSKPKVISRESLPSSKDQLKRPPPKLPVRGTDGRLNAKPKRKLYDEGSDDENAINMIRQMFGYNPNKYRDVDEDSDMEANFDDIMREERRSAKIARKEDEEQLRLIEEEERRERMRLAKKRKQSH